jgi:hypothetical protein
VDGGEDGGVSGGVFWDREGEDLVGYRPRGILRDVRCAITPG